MGQKTAEKLCLGTVQFGLRYGVKNARGRQPTAEECYAVLDAARSGGVTMLDTASVYGTSEQVLGGYGLAGKGLRVCSKLRPDDMERSAVEEAAFVVAEARASLVRLGIPRLYGYLLHRAADMARPGVLDGLVRVRALGLAEHVGVSVYEPEEALAVVHDSRLDIIQIPYNALDQRLDRAGFFDAVRERNAAAQRSPGTEGVQRDAESVRPFRVFARSAFLQGLLLMDPEHLPARIAMAVPFVRRFQEIVGRHGFAPHEAAMLYSLTHAGIDAVVFGVDTTEQLAANLAIAARADAFAPCAAELTGAFDDVPREVVVPSCWS